MNQPVYVDSEVKELVGEDYDKIICYLNEMRESNDFESLQKAHNKLLELCGDKYLILSPREDCVARVFRIDLTSDSPMKIVGRIVFPMSYRSTDG